MYLSCNVWALLTVHYSEVSALVNMISLVYQHIYNYYLYLVNIWCFRVLDDLCEGQNRNLKQDQNNRWTCLSCHSGVQIKSILDINVSPDDSWFENKRYKCKIQNLFGTFFCFEANCRCLAVWCLVFYLTISSVRFLYAGKINSKFVFNFGRFWFPFALDKKSVRIPVRHLRVR